MSDKPKTTLKHSPEKLFTAESAALRGLAELFSRPNGQSIYRRYLLEYIDGELVLRQPEVDAVIEAAIDEAFGTSRNPGGRRILKLRWPLEIVPAGGLK